MDLQLAPDLASIGRGRHWLAGCAAEAGASAWDIAVVELLGSELLSNALVHGPDGTVVTVRFLAHDGRLRVEVDDDGPEAPRVLYPEPHEDGGRGMQLVNRLSASWGLERRDAGGKTVWFELALQV